jgi:hypothetical protein
MLQIKLQGQQCIPVSVAFRNATVTVEDPEPAEVS